MQVDITLKNYRCFPDNEPAKFSVGEGFTAFVGPNGAGKSTALKFFYEFRTVLWNLGGRAVGQLRGTEAYSNSDPDVDQITLFNNQNNRPLHVVLELGSTPSGKHARVGLSAERNVPGFAINHNPPLPAEDHGWLTKQFRAFLASTLYIGSFRNAINLGATSKYFDISVGQGGPSDIRRYADRRGTLGKKMKNPLSRLRARSSRRN